jgi:hypothetical protein
VAGQIISGETCERPIVQLLLSDVVGISINQIFHLSFSDQTRTVLYSDGAKDFISKLLQIDPAHFRYLMLMTYDIYVVENASKENIYLRNQTFLFLDNLLGMAMNRRKSGMESRAQGAITSDDRTSRKAVV